MDTKPVRPTTSPASPTASVPESASKGIDKAGAASRGGDVRGSRSKERGDDFNLALSAESKERADAYRKALEIARKTPDVREDRVQAIKKQLAEGSYQVDSGTIADGMLREAILDKLANTPE